MKYVPGFTFLVGGHLPRVEGHRTSSSILERNIPQRVMISDSSFQMGKTYRLQNIKYSNQTYTYTFLDIQEKKEFQLTFNSQQEADIRIAKLAGDTLNNNPV